MKKKRAVSEKLEPGTSVANETKKTANSSTEFLTDSIQISSGDLTGQAEKYIELNNTANQLPHYFSNNNNNYKNIQQSAMFFDNFSNETKENIPMEQSANVFDYLSSSSPQTTYLQNMVTDIIETPKVVDSFDQNYSLFSQENQPSFLAETQQIIHPHQDTISIDDPEITQNEILEIHKQTDSSLSVQNRQDLIDYLQGNTNEREIQDSSIVGSDSDCLNMHNNQSSIESLKQLSNQMAQAIEPEYAQYSSPITDLEKRNLELAALLEQERLKCEQQKVAMQEYQTKITQLEGEKNVQDEQSQLQMSNLVSKLKEELQYHIQTVGLLVAEKTELSASLSQLEVICKQKSSECEELQARLKASRSRVADLECEVNTFKTERSRIENLGLQQNETSSQLMKECNELKEQKEGLLQDLLEVREKMKNSLDDNVKLQQQLQENSNKLSLAELKIQQITNGKI